jgi:hypothetical protein
MCLVDGPKDKQDVELFFSGILVFNAGKTLQEIQMQISGIQPGMFQLTMV